MKTPYLILRIQDEQDLREEIRKKQDEFLDVYSTWLRGYREPVLRQRLTRLVEELQKEDPAFLPPKIVSELTLG